MAMGKCGWAIGRRYRESGGVKSDGRALKDDGKALKTLSS